MRSTSLSKAVVLYAVLSSSVACGGGEQAPPAASPSSEQPPVDTIRAAPKAEPTEEPTTAGLRCGDFFSAEDAKAIGVEAPGYDEDTTQRKPGMGVVCMAGPLMVGVFRGDMLASMLDGLKAAGEKSGVTLQEGAAVGTASQWTKMGSFHSVMFTASSKRFTGNISGADKALVEKAARAVDAKMN